MIRNLLLLLIFAAAVAGWAFLAYLFFNYDFSEKYFGKAYSRQAPEFNLIDQDGRPISLKRFRDKVVLIEWGYTNCPDVCPVTLSKLNKVMEYLGDEAQHVQVLFVTVDPGRDTADRLKTYVPYFNKAFIGVTGPPEKIEKAARDYGVTVVKHEEVYGRSEKDHWDRYLMTHTNTVFLVDREGMLLLTYPHYLLEPEKIAGDIKKLLRE
ncbi:MAG: SCO family protein [Thermodesulfobacteriota bacterium]